MRNSACAKLADYDGGFHPGDKSADYERERRSGGAGQRQPAQLEMF